MSKSEFSIGKMKKKLSLDYALAFVAACPEAFREELKMKENQALWRSRRSTATVRSKSEVKRLILKHFEIVVDFLMHISG